jgi:ubiquinone/menaquinone biosynthesis C-methylase UbiE
MEDDTTTAAAFATSWNTLPSGSVYTKDQFEDWLAPLTIEEVAGKRVLELGCGNGSLLIHMASWNPSYLEGVDLGDSVRSAEANLSRGGTENWKVVQGDLTEYKSEGFDVVYCIGVLHHLKSPKKGLDAVIRNVEKGGKFHCWVYGKEGNSLVISLVDPLRKVASSLPWWLTKYAVATPLAVPFYLYARCLGLLPKRDLLKKLPLYDYCQWIYRREFAFFRHVAFDQLVSPRTTYIPRQTIEEWLAGYDQIEPGSTYITMRNGNSWKFGGTVKA